jgi:H+/Cl- antiporter ClcA
MRVKKTSHSSLSALLITAMKFALSHRHKRILIIASTRSRRRAIFLLGGVVVGAAAAVLAQLADWAQLVFADLLGHSRYLPFVVTPFGFLLSVYLTNRFFQNAQGSGIPQAIAARRLTDQTARAKLVSLRIAIGKFLLTLFGLLVGASVGREGPTVQIGASIMFALGRFSPRRQPGLILAGASAGVAAAFNTPLAGIIFGIEEMSRSFETRSSTLIIAAVVAAGLTSIALLGNYTYFGTSAMGLRGGIDWLAIPACGIVGGVAGGLFIRCVVAAGASTVFNRRPLIVALLCGLAVAVCGFVSGDTIYGTGYSQVKTALESGTALPEDFGLLKLLATTLSSVSGLPGGIFSPSLAVGAGLGSNVATLFPATPIAAIMLLGMVAYFSGVVQAPITAFVIVIEMTDNHAMVIPLMAAALIAYATSRLIAEEGIYHALAKRFVQPATK